MRDRHSLGTLNNLLDNPNIPDHLNLTGGKGSSELEQSIVLKRLKNECKNPDFGNLSLITKYSNSCKENYNPNYSENLVNRPYRCSKSIFPTSQKKLLN